MDRTPRKEGLSNGTINHGLEIVLRIINLAAGKWVDDRGLTWLQAPPKIKLIPNTGKRQPYPLNWEEQTRLFRELPTHLEEMALFAVNTGCRAAEIYGLRWDYEVDVPELRTSVFIIPGAGVKNGDDRLVALNRVAASVVSARRGRHPTHVFAYEGERIGRMVACRRRRGRGQEGGLSLTRRAFMI
jgi:integrase